MEYKDFLSIGYKPTINDLICTFKIKPAEGLSIKDAACRVASESSVGTWTEITTAPKNLKNISAKVYEIKGNYVRIAYPSILFEPGNMPQILSSIAGNIFNMKDVDALRLEDVKWPEKIKSSFPGPKFGIPGIRKLLKIKSRPLCGTIIKPKLGLDASGHAQVAYNAWYGGIDIVKDDENLTSQSFNAFETRIVKTLKMRDKAESETGEKKIYMPNVTAETTEMLRRTEFVAEHGGEYIMVDILTAGWAALQTLREKTGELGLVMHAHRAMHGALTRNKDHSISFLVLAEIGRLIGVDQIHIGTAVGKMLETKEEVKTVEEDIEEDYASASRHRIAESWKGIKPVFAVCSGGLHPGHVPALMKMLGNDIIIQAGGGVHGHPGGTIAGARAMRQAIDAIMQHEGIREYAKTHKELKAAIEKWGCAR